MDLHLQLEPSDKPEWWERSAIALPVLVWIHGGGWMGGAKGNELRNFGRALEEGYHVINVEYRLGRGTAPAACEDIHSVLQWIEKNAAEYKLDPTRIILGGGSAGGHLALLTGAVHGRAPRSTVRIRGIVNWFGVADMRSMLEHVQANLPANDQFVSDWIEGTADKDALLKDVSPLSHLGPATPPVLTIHGTADDIVPFGQAVALDEALHKVEVQHRVVRLEAGGHGAFSQAQWIEAYDAVSDFMEVAVSTT